MYSKTATLFATAAMAGSALAIGACTGESTCLTIVLSGCQGGDACTNTTINQFVGQQGQVGGVPTSIAYLTDAQGVDINSVTCTLFGQGAVTYGTFTAATPDAISTNTFEIYGISCSSTDPALSSTSSSASSTSPSGTSSSNSTAPLTTPASSHGGNNSTVPKVTSTVEQTTLPNGAVTMTTVLSTITPTPAGGNRSVSASGTPIASTNGAGAHFAQGGFAALAVAAAAGLAFAF